MALGRIVAPAAVLMAGALGGCVSEEGVAISRGGLGAVTSAYRVTLDDGGRGWGVAGPNMAAVLRRAREVCLNRGTQVRDTQTNRVGRLWSRRTEVVITVQCTAPRTPPERR